MKAYFFLPLFIVSIFTCKKEQQKVDQITISQKINTDSIDFTIAFGSCNNQRKENLLWDDILEIQPDVWIWGGDIVYSDTDDHVKMKRDYLLLTDQPDYKTITKETRIMGTWDDHDYGLNDGGKEFVMKEKSQQIFLDFLNVPENHPRRNREGVYHSEELKNKSGVVKIIALDTRYFRTSLTASAQLGKRYQPNEYGTGTILGESQWNWLENELKNSQADFTIIISSIQFLSDQHGYETWGNFPHEQDKLINLLVENQVKNPILLSGDRHISEFSVKNISKLENPLIDFTSSGMTHSYNSFSGEPNPYRIGKVVSDKSFGVLKINFEDENVIMEMRGDQGKVFQQKIFQF